MIDRLWKRYLIDVCFGLGFDTSTDIALLGITSIQGSETTNIWLMLVVPVLFTVSMCLLDPMDRAMMLAVQVRLIAASRVQAKQENITEVGADDATEERYKDPSFSCKTVLLGVPSASILSLLVWRLCHSMSCDGGRVGKRRRVRDRMNDVNLTVRIEVVKESDMQVLGKSRDGKSGNAETPTTTGAVSSCWTGSLDERIEPA